MRRAIFNEEHLGCTLIYRRTHIVRNLYRQLPFLTYLFGASPAFDESFQPLNSSTEDALPTRFRCSSTHVLRPVDTLSNGITCINPAPVSFAIPCNSPSVCPFGISDSRIAFRRSVGT